MAVAEVAAASAAGHEFGAFREPRRTLSSTRFRCSSVTSGPRCSAPVPGRSGDGRPGRRPSRGTPPSVPGRCGSASTHADLVPAEYCVRTGRSCGCHSSAKLVTWRASVGRGAAAIPELSLFRFREAIPERVQRIRTTRSWRGTNGQARGPDEFSAPTPSMPAPDFRPRPCRPPHRRMTKKPKTTHPKKMHPVRTCARDFERYRA